MKPLFPVLFLLLPILMMAQAYTPIAVEGAQWVMYQNAEADSNKTLFGYVIKGDSIANGTTYKKVFYRKFKYEAGIQTPPFEIQKEEFYALVRDDTSARKVYAIGAEYNDLNFPCLPDTSLERLWYDFSKEIGDTLIYQCVYNPPTNGAFLLDSISEDTYFGYDRNTYHGYMADSNGMIWSATEPHFIEGIGSRRGLFDPAVGEEYIPSAAVDLVYYCIGSDAECQILTSLHQPDIIDHSMYPNPVADLLQIKLGSGVEYPMTMHIYDLLGKSVMIKKIPTPQSEIFVGDWMPGTYTYVLYHKGKVMARAQFLKM